MRTIAWYHFLAGEKSPAEMCNWLPLSDLDLATIYRYRRGEISPNDELLFTDDEIFHAARAVYEVGPFQVPLWDAFWGSLSAEDFRLADRLMPGGDWPQFVLDELFFDDGILARVINFRNVSVRAEGMTADLLTFSLALRVFRATQMLQSGNLIPLRVLLEGTMALPGARGVLAQYGLFDPIRDWVALQFGTASTRNAEPIYWAAWMSNDDEFMRQCMLADMRRGQMRRDLLSKGKGDFAQEVITDCDSSDNWH